MNGQFRGFIGLANVETLVAKERNMLRYVLGSTHSSNLQWRVDSQYKSSG